MGQISYTNAVTGTVNGLSHSFSGTFSGVIRNFFVNDLEVTNAWQDVLLGDTFAIIVLKNTGTDDALYRVFDGTNYYRMNLPAGKVVMIHRGPKTPYFSNTTSVVAVYSTSGTNIQAGVFY